MSSDLAQLKYNREVLIDLKRRFSRVDEVTLIRFLSSCTTDSKFEEAAATIERFQSWREANFPITSASIYNEMRTGKLYVHGCDSLGHPLIVFKPYLSDPKTRNIDEMIRLLLFMAEVAIQQLPENKLMFSVLVDRSGPHKPDFEMLRLVSDLIAEYYPGRLHKVFFHPCSMVLKAFWQLAKKFSPPGADKRFRPKGTLAALRAVIPDEHIPVAMGGACKYEFSVDDFPSPFLNESYYTSSGPNDSDARDFDRDIDRSSGGTDGGYPRGGRGRGRALAADDLADEDEDEYDRRSSSPSTSSGWKNAARTSNSTPYR